MTTETMTSYAASQILIELILKNGMLHESLERQTGVNLAQNKAGACKKLSAPGFDHLTLVKN